MTSPGACPWPARLKIFALLGAAGSMIFAAGCATPGPLHVYSLPAAPAAFIHDLGPDARAEAPSFLAPGEILTGFAYDPFTDHFFLRLAPGNRIRVVDRPARAVKREFVTTDLPTTGGGDLAIRPRDGHLFLLHPTEPKIIELTRLGAWVRAISLEGAGAPPKAIAYDVKHDRLLTVGSTAPPRIAVHDLDGHSLASIALEREVAPSLAFDSDAREFYAPFAGAGTAVGVFDEAGRLRRTLTMPAGFVDTGPRSFLRVF